MQQSHAMVTHSSIPFHLITVSEAQGIQGKTSHVFHHFYSQRLLLFLVVGYFKAPFL